MIGLIKPDWAFRAGIYQMPIVANGQPLESMPKSHGINAELTTQPGHYGTIVRFLTYRNTASMGNYRTAINYGIQNGTTPDVAADDSPGRIKYGFGLNIEQPIANDGETGFFSRIGWNNGQTETFAYTEADRTFSIGAQISGANWDRHDDRLGIAFGMNGLSQDHRDYLAAGGQGFVLGDGRLNYGLEKITEVYYRIQIGKYIQVSPDLQCIVNPGYNIDRGPAWVIGLRLHLEY